MNPTLRRPWRPERYLHPAWGALSLAWSCLTMPAIAGGDLSMLSDFGRQDIAQARLGVSGTPGNEAGISQEGSGHRAQIVQSGGGHHIAQVWQDGRDDLASVEQLGAGNEARIGQWRDGNAVSVMQAGLSNLLAIQQWGDHASVQGQQIGDGNMVVVVQQSDAQLSFFQQGQGNQIVADMPAGLSLRVEQVGNGLSFSLSH